MDRLLQLERRIAELECQFAEMQSSLQWASFRSNVRDTFAMFADDPVFDEIVELGRESRASANTFDCDSQDKEP